MSSRFDSFVLDSETGRLLGPGGEVRLRPQAFRMLEVLVEQAPKVLSQEELLDRVWGVEHLSSTSVKQAISEIRQALRDDPARPAIVETVHRRGYRFIASLEPVQEQPAASPEPVASLRPPGPKHWALPFRRAANMIPVLARLSAIALAQQALPENGWARTRKPWRRGASQARRNERRRRGGRKGP